MSLLALIPARGGSKGILKKNIKLLFGKPLIAWTIDAAKKAKCIDRIVVSTDDPEIAKVAKERGADVPFVRPAEYATDEAPSINLALHAIEQIQGFDWIMLLQPTSPLRNTSDIDNIFKFCQDHKSSSAVSVNEVSKHPYRMYQRDSFFNLKPFISNHPHVIRRQNLPSAYSLNGALYLARVDWLLKYKSFVRPDTLGYTMPIERSVDIDTEQDWNWAEYLMKKDQ